MHHIENSRQDLMSNIAFDANLAFAHFTTQLDGLSFTPAANLFFEKTFGERSQKMKDLLTKTVAVYSNRIGEPEPGMNPAFIFDTANYAGDLKNPPHPEFVGVTEFGLTKGALLDVSQGGQLKISCAVSYHFTSPTCGMKDHIAEKSADQIQLGLTNVMAALSKAFPVLAEVIVEAKGRVLPYGTWNDKCATPRASNRYRGLDREYANGQSADLIQLGGVRK